jgi:small subunit ribosomal protein S5
MAGGRRFSFSVLMAIGDKKGKVGVGLGKASDTSLAIQKAFNSAKKNMVKLALNSDHSIGHTVSAKFNSAKIELRPNYGRGVVAGSALRTIIELAGMKDITGKVQSRSKNKLNNARATILALEPFVAERGLKVTAKKPTDAESKPRSNSSRDRAPRAARPRS